ncbi:MAG: hypothetical protein ACI86M_003758 [Saprospiraceae bacterium]
MKIASLSPEARYPPSSLSLTINIISSIYPKLTHLYHFWFLRNGALIKYVLCADIYSFSKAKNAGNAEHRRGLGMIY